MTFPIDSATTKRAEKQSSTHRPSTKKTRTHRYAFGKNIKLPSEWKPLAHCKASIGYTLWNLHERTGFYSYLCCFLLTCCRMKTLLKTSLIPRWYLQTLRKVFEQ